MKHFSIEYNQVKNTLFSKRSSYICISIVICIFVILFKPKNVVHADDKIEILIEDLIRQRKKIQYGKMKLTLNYEVAKIMLNSYQDVTKNIDTEFYCENDFFLQEVHLIHPRWKRRTVSLVNNNGAFHDQGGNTIYGSLASPQSSKTIGPSRPDSFDFRFLGLMFPLNQLVAPKNWTPVASWSRGLKIIDTEKVKDSKGHVLNRFNCSIEQESQIRIVLDHTAGNVPILVRRSHNDTV
tara:strand:+ start:5594 stop:6307 length:714 start_codon:yes stop_codon:yes gene_type:complete